MKFKFRTLPGCCNTLKLRKTWTVVNVFQFAHFFASRGCEKFRFAVQKVCKQIYCNKRQLFPVKWQFTELGECMEQSFLMFIFFAVHFRQSFQFKSEKSSNSLARKLSAFICFPEASKISHIRVDCSKSAEFTSKINF